MLVFFFLFLFPFPSLIIQMRLVKVSMSLEMGSHGGPEWDGSQRSRRVRRASTY